MVQYIFGIKILSKDTLSFRRRDWLKKKMKDTVRLKYNAVWAKPNMVNVNEMDWIMICKMNEMEMNDEINELDFGTWNE